MLFATSIALAPFAPSLVWVIAIMAISKSGGPIAASQVWSIPGDIAPKNMVSLLGALQNSISNMAGILGPIATGIIIQFTGSFSRALLAVGLVTMLGAVNFLFFLGKVEPIRAKGVQDSVLAVKGGTA
jgi:ACS family glucarate transporter-like MFS transporter